MKKVLVLGGGFAGVEVAIYLRKQEIEVTLVSNRDYFYLYPISIWIPTGKVTKEDVSIPLIDLARKHKFKLIVDEVIDVNAKEKKVTLKNEILEGFTYIVLALGQDKLQPKGIEHTLSICGKPEEAVELYKRLDTLIESDKPAKIAMGFGGNPHDNSAVRGGPAFELLFNVDHYLRQRKVRQNFELTFFAPMEKPGQKMGERALMLLGKMFKAKEIKQKVGSKIIAFEKDGIVFEDETKIVSDLTMFISAGTGHHVLLDSGLPLNEAGYVVTNEYNETEGFEGIYAIGDSSALLGAKWKAKQGHIAEIMAKNVAYNIFQDMQKINSKRSYLKDIKILCMMDIGNGASLVYRNDTTIAIIPLPIVGHWIKKMWGWYCKKSKLGKIPRIYGL